jgi:hypothetical protein
MSSNGKRDRRPDEPHVDGKHATRLRVARQVARDQQTRTSPSISLPRVSCLEESPDGEAPERAA